MKTIDIADEDVNEFIKLMLRLRFSSHYRLPRYQYIINYIINQLAPLEKTSSPNDSEIKNVK